MQLLQGLKRVKGSIMAASVKLQEKLKAGCQQRHPGNWCNAGGRVEHGPTKLKSFTQQGQK